MPCVAWTSAWPPRSQSRVQSHPACLAARPGLSAVSVLVGGLSTVEWFLAVYCFVNLEGKEKCSYASEVLNRKKFLYYTYPRPTQVTPGVDFIVRGWTLSVLHSSALPSFPKCLLEKFSFVCMLEDSAKEFPGQETDSLGEKVEKTKLFISLRKESGLNK